MVTPAEPILKGKSEDMGSLRGPRKPAPKAAEPSGPKHEPAAPGSITQKRMHIIDIIKQSLQKEMPGTNPDKGLEAIGKMVQKHEAAIIQLGNTVFLLKHLQPYTVELHTMSTEPPAKIVERWRTFLTKTGPEMGVKKVVSFSTTPAINKLVEQIGLPVKTTQSQQMMGKKMVPAYKYEIEI
jgi:hypothetical protein